MRMHAAAGDRAEALRVFAKCRELLREELGVAPRRRQKRFTWKSCARNRQRTLG